jgi:single-stranded DNA-binding protein
MNYQKIILVGNATEDAERKTSLKGDVEYTTFGLAVGDGMRQTNFFSVVVFGNQGKPVADHVTRGRQVLVEGRIEVTNKDRFKVVADNVWFGPEPAGVKDAN